MSDKTFDNIWRIMREYKFELEHDISVDLKCTLCQKMLINACNGPCGCRYCFQCIENYLQNANNFCPGKLKECKEEKLNFDKDIQIDRVANLQISKVKVKCPEQSCRFVDELRNIEFHIRVCDARGVSCPYLIIGCSESKIGVDNFYNHLSVDNYSHTKLLIEWIENIRNEIEIFQRKFTKLETDNDTFKRDKEYLSKQISDLQCSNNEKNEEIKKMSEKMNKMESQFNELQLMFKLDQISTNNLNHNNMSNGIESPPNSRPSSPRVIKSSPNTPKSNSLKSGILNKFSRHRIIEQAIFYSTPSDMGQILTLPDNNSPQFSHQT